MKKETICAVVVTYNRKKLLIECLEALVKQTKPIDAIYIIDNASTDKTPELLEEKGYIKELPPENLKEPWEKEFQIRNLTDGKPIKIHYVRMHENTGGAGGFHEGIKRAHTKGYDWLWLMDDDAEPLTNSLEILLKDLPNENLSAVVCNVIDESGTPLYGHKGIFSKSKIFTPLSYKDVKKVDEIYIDVASFVGYLLSKKAIDKAGYPYKEFFIWYDDTEYSLRIRKFGKILFRKNSLIKHKLKGNRLVMKNFLFINFLVFPTIEYWKYLCGVRNKAYIYKTHSSKLFIPFFYLKHLLQIIFIEEHKFLKLKYLVKYMKQTDLNKFETVKPNEWKELVERL